MLSGAQINLPLLPSNLQVVHVIKLSANLPHSASVAADAEHHMKKIVTTL